MSMEYLIEQQVHNTMKRVENHINFLDMVTHNIEFGDKLRTITYKFRDREELAILKFKWVTEITEGVEGICEVTVNNTTRTFDIVDVKPDETPDNPNDNEVEVKPIDELVEFVTNHINAFVDKKLEAL